MIENEKNEKLGEEVVKLLNNHVIVSNDNKYAITYEQDSTFQPVLADENTHIYSNSGTIGNDVDVAKGLAYELFDGDTGQVYDLFDQFSGHNDWLVTKLTEIATDQDKYFAPIASHYLVGQIKETYAIFNDSLDSDWELVGYAIYDTNNENNNWKNQQDWLKNCVKDYLYQVNKVNQEQVYTIVLRDNTRKPLNEQLEQDAIIDQISGVITKNDVPSYSELKKYAKSLNLPNNEKDYQNWHKAHLLTQYQ